VFTQNATPAEARGSGGGTFSRLAAFKGAGARKRGAGVTVERQMLGTILLVVLILIVLGALPTWPYSAGWGYYPSGGVGIVLVIVIVLLLMGRI
jgi:hypothetical protein